MMLGFFGALRLAPNGTDPGPPDGITLQVGTLFPIYAAEPNLRLLYQMRPDDYFVQGFPWDWRMSILPAGDALADVIREANTPANPCSIIAHSAGGLVARRAWSNLVGTGQQGLVRRIVTLGTPHWGSYSSVLVFSGVSPLIDGLLSLNGTLASASNSTITSPFYHRWTRLEIQQLCWTWPSLYELFPVVGAPDATDDPDRADLFHAANWGGGVLPQQAWLDHAYGPYRAWVLSPQSLPPDDVMTCVGGTGQDTRTRLINVQMLGTDGAVGSTEEGDDTVTLRSSLLNMSQQIRVQCQHANLFPNSVDNGDARRWIEAVRSPTPIPPPPTVSVAPQTNELQPIPGVTTLGAPNGGPGSMDYTHPGTAQGC
jgi:hypothetical protein